MDYGSLKKDLQERLKESIDMEGKGMGSEDETKVGVSIPTELPNTSEAEDVSNGKGKEDHRDPDEGTHMEASTKSSDAKGGDTRKRTTAPSSDAQPTLSKRLKSKEDSPGDEMHECHGEKGYGKGLDPLLDVAFQHWNPANVATPMYNRELVHTIYDGELCGKSVAGDRFRKGVRTLEITQYLELYLWKTLDTIEVDSVHLMSIVHLINHKFYEGLDVWTCLRDRQDRFKIFFRKMLGVLLSFSETPSASQVREHCALLLFLSNMFASLEEPMVRKEILRLVSLSLWHHIPSNRRELEFAAQPALAKAWRTAEKREARRFQNRDAGTECSVQIAEERPEAIALPKLLGIYWKMLLLALPKSTGSPDSELVHAASAYCHYFMELLVDLLSQLPTRRIVHVWMDANAVLVGSRHSKLYHSKLGARTFCRLVDRATFYDNFAMDNITGNPLSPDEVQAAGDRRALKLQQLLFLHWKDRIYARDMVFVPVSKIERGGALKQFVESLSEAELEKLACRQLRMLCYNSAKSMLPATDFKEEKDILAQTIMEKFGTEYSPLPASKIAEQMSIYPDESDVGDERLTDTIDHRLLAAHKILSVDEKSLLVPCCFPKLSLQYLTMEDYLLRHLELYRLEAAAAVRDDLMECLLRLQPSTNGAGQFTLGGWSRMGLAVSDVHIGEVQPPRLGHTVPSRVYATVQVDITGARSPQARYEWSRLSAGDIIFLVELSMEAQPSLKHAEALQKSGVMAKLGLKRLRGAKIVRDVELQEGEGKLSIDVLLDPSQYAKDQLQAIDVASFHVVMRRKAKENNFSAVLSCMQSMLSTEEAGERDVPVWLRDVLLGYGDPSAASSPIVLPGSSEEVVLDFGRTFQDVEHLKEAFSHVKDFEIMGALQDNGTEEPSWSCKLHFRGRERLPFRAEVYPSSGASSHQRCTKNPTSLCFTHTQLLAIGCGIRTGLTLIQGPPGTGKTDVAVQIARLLHRNYPKQRILVITHSNHALNDIFAKIAGLGDGSDGGVPQRYLLRLGKGETDLRMKDEDDEGDQDPRMMSIQTFDELALLNSANAEQPLLSRQGTSECETMDDQAKVDMEAKYDTTFMHHDPDSKFCYDFTRQGRIDHMLLRRQELLKRVARLARSLGLDQEEAESASYSCENARQFWTVHVSPTWEAFTKQKKSRQAKEDGLANDSTPFPFQAYFNDITATAGGLNVILETAVDSTTDRYEELLFDNIRSIFTDLEECRPFELITRASERGNFLLTTHAKLVAMTCTHAAMRRADFLRLGLFFDSIIVEESAQITEVESFIPLTLQQGNKRLKRAVLIGDHKQLPPVIRCAALRRESHMDQSLFARLVRLGVPAILLDKQGRSRPQLAELYRWHYPGLGDLSHVHHNKEFQTAVGGFGHTFQLVDVPEGSEHSPAPHAFQNLCEAEFLASVFQYARLCGHPRKSISVLTTYASQKQLLRDVFARRCGQNPLFGMPADISTVDEFQGQQNDIVLLSLVRTASIGHIRDVRRLVVALSRARLALYIFCRHELFFGCNELRPLFLQSKSRPLKLELVPDEMATTSRRADELGSVPTYLVQNSTAMHSLVDSMTSKRWKEIQSTQGEGEITEGDRDEAC